jgi:hypothetical protein
MLPTALALSLPQNRYTSFAFLFIVFAILSQTPFYTTGATDYVEGCMAGMALLQFITLVFWSNSRRDSWRLDEPQQKAVGGRSRRLLERGGVGDWSSQLGR